MTTVSAAGLGNNDGKDRQQYKFQARSNDRLSGTSNEAITEYRIEKQGCTDSYRTTR